MPRNRGNNNGFRPGPPRGRGRGRGRGFRGGFRGGGGGGGGEGMLVFDGNFEDFHLDHIMPPTRGRDVSPARGRGGFQMPPRGYQTPPRGYQTPPRGYNTPPRGYQTPPGGFQPRGGRGGRMRGIGFSANKFAGGSQRSYISLSVLERDRPLLQPVVFVRSEHQKTLFEEVEEILHAPGEEGRAIENHAPSADVVERLFKVDDPSPGDSEGVAMDAGIGSASTSGSEADEVPGVTATDAIEATVPTSIVEDAAPTFIVDITPSPIVLDYQPQQTVAGPSALASTPLGDPALDDEVIVYVAPHPRTGRSTPAIPSPTLPAQKPLPNFPESSILPIQPEQPPAATAIDHTPLALSPPIAGHKSRAFQAQARTRFGLKPTPRSRKIAKKERAAARRRAEREAMFSSAGLGLSADELRVLQSDALPKVDPREAERRRGDSDIEWGTDDDGGVEEVMSGLGDMELDPELADTAAFAQFARGVQGLGAGEVVTIADLEDAARMAEEDEEEADDGDESDQDDDVFDAEERREIGEGLDSDSSGSSDDEGAGFQARLHRLREKAKGKAVVDAEASSTGDGDTDDDDVFGPDFSWADRDESFLQGIEDLLDDNDDILQGGDRKSRNKLFKAIQNGEFGDDLNMRKKDRSIPLHLRDQWERDRVKKADRKRQRALARLEETAIRKGLGRKKKEKIFGSGRFEGDTLIADGASDMAVLEQQIRKFLRNLELKSMELPPRSKEWRRRAHLLADAFNLKSKSKGKGEGRFTTLIKTTRSGVGVNERKVSQLVHGNKGEGFRTPTRTGRPIQNIRNRDGDEVGKMAPKLSEENVGFKLLQKMGWEEGDRIGGITGGLVDPLMAIIKTTKLGLGATR